MAVKISGTGSCLPEFVLTNEMLSEMVDTNDEWITTRTGIKTRRILTKETLSDIAYTASANALKDAKLNADDIDMIICATLHGEYAVPSLACLIQQKLGASCPAFDLNAACTGFIYGLNLAAALIKSRAANRVLLVAAEALSETTDYTDRSTCVLFGDGAGAVVLERGRGLLSVFTAAKGNADMLRIPNSKGNFPFAGKKTLPQYLYMNGQEVYKFAVNAICSDIKKALSLSGMQIEEINFFLIHQANNRIIEAAAKKLGIPQERILKNIDRYGNTSAACIPLMLDEYRKGKILKKGMKLLLSAFGGGMTSGAAVMRLT